MERLLSICPKLNTFNKVYISRHGAGLMPNVELIGSKDDIDAFILDEIRLLQNENIIINDTPITDIHDQNTPQLYLLKTDKNLNRIKGNLYFFSERCNDDNKNVFNITGYHINPNQVIVDTINLNGLNLETVENIRNKTKDISDEKFINNTILCHYEKYDDDEFHAEDFDWINEFIKEEPIKKESQPKFNNLQESISQKSEREEKLNENNSPQKTSQNKKPKMISPEPIVKEKDNKHEGLYSGSKETLTPEEETHNEALVKDLIQKYNDMADFIKKMHASQWVALGKKIEKAAKTKNFNEQWCPQYLEISDDITSELYAKLYQLDIDTQEFHKNIVHQVIVLGCFACGENWKEDITFLPKGPHFIECPNCYAERGFEKQ